MKSCAIVSDRLIFLAPPRWSRATAAAVVCLVLGLLATVPLALLTPPFQVPDEGQHFFRAYAISEGDFEPVVQHGEGGAMVPSSLLDLVQTFLGTRANLADRSVTPQPLAVTAGQLSVPLVPQRKEFKAFPAAAYSPLGYLPQATAIAIGRALGAAPLLLLYLGRLANAFIAIGVLSWAVWLTPARREIVCLLGLLPMALAEYASVSADASVIACAFLITAIGLRCQVTGTLPSYAGFALAIAGGILCSVKPPYAPLLLSGLAGVVHGRQPAVLLSRYAAALVAAIGIAAAWLGSAHAFAHPPNFDPAGQVRYIFEHPLHFLLVIQRAYLSTTVWLLYLGFVGILGWLSVALPSFAYSLFAVSFLLCAILPYQTEVRISQWPVGWNFLMVAAASVLLVAAAYVEWTPVGSPIVWGMQGRYLLPIAPLLGCTFGAIVPRFKTQHATELALPLAAIVAAVLGIATVTAIVQAFRVF